MSGPNRSFNALPLFQWIDRGGHMRPVRNLPRPFPRRIDDYRVTKKKWIGILPAEQQDIASILGQDLDMDDKTTCIICREDATNCALEQCIDDFRATVALNGANQTEIRGLGDRRGGKGVFATAPIGKDTRLGEYLGELVPPTPAPARGPGARHLVRLDGGTVVDARRCGNWTRFVGHHCRPNVRVDRAMYGARRCLLLRATRDLAAGEELRCHYGGEYFARLGARCRCDARPGPHVPDDEGDGYESDHVPRPRRKRGRRRRGEPGPQVDEASDPFLRPGRK